MSIKCTATTFKDAIKGFHSAIDRLDAKEINKILKFSGDLYAGLECDTSEEQNDCLIAFSLLNEKAILKVMELEDKGMK